MTPIVKAHHAVEKDSPPVGKNSGIRNAESTKESSYLSHLSREAVELMVRLNELAKGYPFNIMYRAKNHDPR